MRIIIKSIFWFLLNIMYRIKINGKENIPKDTAVLICPNHVHALDSTILIAWSKRKINVFAKEELFRGRIGKWFANIFGIYPIKRDAADIQAIKIALKLLKNNEPLMICPEGSRNGMEKGLPLKNGPVLMAIKSGAPILPVGIKGTFRLFTKVTVNIGKPIYYDEYKDKTKQKDVISELTKELMEEDVRLRDQ